MFGPVPLFLFGFFLFDENKLKKRKEEIQFKILVDLA